MSRDRSACVDSARPSRVSRKPHYPPPASPRELTHVLSKPQTSARNDPGSFVYVISDAAGRTKIGISGDPAARLNQIRTGNTEPLDFAFIAACDGDSRQIERVAHRALAGQRIAGEWFAVKPSVAIAAVVTAAQQLNINICSLTENQVKTTVAIARSRKRPELSAAGIAACLVGGLLLGPLRRR